MQLQKAQRHQVKLRLGLSGASGFGKSYSALLLAYGITEDWTKIAVIDTENNSASLYSHLGNFNVVSLSEPYSPERYIQAIRLCEKEKQEVIIIDSISHEWQGKGGCLHLHEQLGGKFSDWASLTPRHQSFIDAILSSNCHIITTVRKKMDYSMDRDSNGKTRVIKHGLKDITRDGFSYELTVDFELINENHMAKATKDRTGLFMDKPEIIITESVGKMLVQWCNQGISIEEAKLEIAECKSIEGLRLLYQKYSGLRKELNDTILNRRLEIENLKSVVVEQNEIIHPNKISQNGINR
ncbi:AAA family ATPase [Polaribacter sp.]|uniref:AAA family ATPase n=1 Tax=Polaribacter sp. TaxID=1920175 RepID=UPI004047D19D